jgi:tRNA threonylcarbamoyladenosine biosynthesis protein TsaE
MKKITASARETQKIARDLAYIILHITHKRAVVVGLVGELGSGKTVFAQGFAKGLGIKDNVVSPTFVLMRIYALCVPHYSHFIHIDAYRIEKPKELIDLGFKELVRNPQNIILIEWADRIKNILPKNCILIKFEHVNKNKRKITLKIPNS